MAFATQENWRQRMLRWGYENLQILGWIAAWLITCLLVVFAAALWMASRSRTVVVFYNDSASAIHDVVLKPAAASSREPRHFLPHLPVGRHESFVMYPLSRCELKLEYLDDSGERHTWHGGRIAPAAGKTTIHLAPSGSVTSSN